MELPRLKLTSKSRDVEARDIDQQRWNEVTELNGLVLSPPSSSGC